MAANGEKDVAAESPPPDAWRRAYDALGHVGGVVLAVMAGAVFLQVVFRFAGVTVIDGLEEVPRYLFVWLIMIGAASAMQRSEHTVLDYFIMRMPSKARAAVVLLTTVLAIGLFVWLIKLSYVLVPNAQLQTSAGLDLPLGYVFAAIPVGSVLIILPMFRTLAAAVRVLWPRRS
ncbi:MAG: TRAP transporter small permease [Alphaproteobacteria bacterium]